MKANSINELLQKWERIYAMPNPLLQHLQQSFELVKVNRRRTIYRPGDNGGYLIFVKEGVLRSYIRCGNKTATTSLSLADDFVVVQPKGMFEKNEPMGEHIESLGKSVLIIIPMEIIELLYWKYPALNFIMRYLLEGQLRADKEQNRLLHISDRETRLEQAHPIIEKLQANVAATHIAALLNISREGLGRYKKAK